MPIIRVGHWASRKEAPVETSQATAEVVEYDGTKYAEIIWAGAQVKHTRFFSAPDSSFQFGLLAHEAGYRERPHFHKAVTRTIQDLQQMFVVQRGVVHVELYSDDGNLHRVVRPCAGDAIVLVHGAHAIRVTEDFQALSIKQGPYFGAEEGQVEIYAALLQS